MAKHHTKDTYEVTDKVLQTVFEGASKGLSMSTIAKSILWSTDTFTQKRKKHPELDEALRKGHDVLMDKVEEKIYSRALDHDSETMLIWISRTKGKYRGWTTQLQESNNKDINITINGIPVQQIETNKEEKNDNE